MKYKCDLCNNNAVYGSDTYALCRECSAKVLMKSYINSDMKWPVLEEKEAKCNQDK